MTMPNDRSVGYDAKEPPEGKPVCVCDDCGDDICRGETYYRIGDAFICEDCIYDYAVIAGEEDD